VARGDVDPETRAVYERAQLGRSLEWGACPAVLVVDLSPGFTDPANPLGADLDEVVAATRRLLDEARRASVPVVFSIVAFDPSLRDAGLWIEKYPATRAFVHGSPLVEPDPRLGRRPDEPVVTKPAGSAFFGTNLAALLTASRVDTVVICGATTSGCVRATATDALQHGFVPVVPRECVGDRAEGPHLANLFDIQAKYADVVPLDEVVAHLAAVAGLP